MDLSTCAIKLDHSVGTPDPLPNWRQVPGFPVFGLGQPTEKGLAQVKEKLGKDKVIWFNLRVEPVGYVDGLPVAARAPEALHTNIQIPLAEAEGMEAKLMKEIAGRAKDGVVEIHKDQGLAENPMDRVDEKLTAKAEGAKGFNEILAGLKEGEQALPGLQVIRSETHLFFSDEKLYVIALAGDINQSCLTRVPFDEQRALPEECFDLIAKSLSGESAATTQCVFSSQLGQGRSTLGMVVASIVKVAHLHDCFDDLNYCF